MREHEHHHHAKTDADYVAEIDQAIELLQHNKSSTGAIFRTILESQKGLMRFVAAIYVNQELIYERLEQQMAIDTTVTDQKAADALAAVKTLATSHGTTETQAQTIVDGFGTKFDEIRDTAKTATPADTTVAGTGGDTVTATAGQ